MNWFQKHKRGIITAGCIGLGIGFGLAGYLFFKKNELIPISIFSPKKTTVPNNISTTVSEGAKFATSEAIETSDKIIDIEPFVRNLPPNCHPSVDKVNTAVENGFPNLLANQTWVCPQKRVYRIKTA